MPMTHITLISPFIIILTHSSDTTHTLVIVSINPLNAELNPIYHLLALGAHHILHVGRIRVNAVAVDKV
jgi:hypothetical protein